MSDATSFESVQQFAADLRRIRQARGLTTAYLHNETKIPLSLLDSFEETGLYHHPMFNRVYLRSFVRSYSEVLGVSSDVTLQALDEAFDGRYSGRLRWEYLGEPRPAGVPDEAEKAETTTSEEVIPTAGLAGTTRAADEAYGAQRGEAEAGYGKTDVNWAAQSPPPRRYDYTEEPSTSGFKWILLFLGVAAVAAVAFFLLRGRLGGGESEEPPALALEDTVAQIDTAATPAATPDTAAITLPDTLHLQLFALNNGIQGVKVKRDEGSRAPYWAEPDSVLRYRFINRITLENDLADMRITVEGRPYTGTPDSLGVVVITRDSIKRAWAAAPAP